MGDRLDHLPSELSGGQQQRVAVARAIVTNPALMLADEPTGNLDSHSTAEVLDIFARLHDEGRTIVLITHEDEVAAAGRAGHPDRRRRDRRGRAGVNAAETLRIALGGIAANKLRSGLTILGMTIGVAAVIILVAVGNGLQAPGPGADRRARLQRAARAGARRALRGRAAAAAASR